MRVTGDGRPPEFTEIPTGAVLRAKQEDTVMQEGEFCQFLETKFEEGRARFAGMTQQLLSHFAPSLFQMLDMNDNSVWLDPALFAYFSSPKPSIKLPQLLYGYLPEPARPPVLECYADGNGVIYLPALGYLVTAVADQPVRLTARPASATYELVTRDGQSIDFVFSPLPTVPGTSMDVLSYPNPLLRRLFHDRVGRPVEVEIRAAAGQHIENAGRALDVIGQVCPWYHAALTSATRQLVIFSGDGVNSFATLAAHGIAFCNARSSDDEVFFIEDLAHQCGHVVLSDVMFEPQEYFQIPADTPLRSLTGHQEETRTIYVAFHGVFTEALMNMCLNRCLELGIFRGRQEHELLGRLSYILRRFEIDLSFLGEHPESIFTEDGLRLYRFCAQTFQHVHGRRHQELDHYDLHGQPYNFDYPKFTERNPRCVTDPADPATVGASAVAAP